MAPLIVITFRVHPEVLELISRSCEVRVIARGSHGMAAPDGKVDAILTDGSDVIDREVLHSYRDLRIISVTSDEHGAIDVQACTDQGVWVAVARANRESPAGDVRLALELEAAANIFEALTGSPPKGAINLPPHRACILRLSDSL